MKRLSRTTIASLTLLLSGVSMALRAAEHSAMTEPLSSSQSIMQMLSGLAVVLALFIALAWLLKRFGRGQLHGGGTLFRTLGAMPVGTRERLLLIEIGGEQFVLAVTPGQISKIHHFEQPIALPEPGSDSDFATRLKSLIEQRRSTP